MKYILALVILASTFVACTSSSHKQNTDTVEEKPRTNIVIYKSINKDSVLNTFDNWYNYYYVNINLSQDFKALDVDSAVIDKQIFLNKLKTGQFSPFKVGIINDTSVYKLYAGNGNIKSIRETIMQFADYEIRNMEWEGNELPPYNFKGLNNEEFTNVNTKGKVIMLKCWFINCTACVKEFPQLNKLVIENSSNKNVLFISLASDGAKELQKFLQTHPFSYSIIPNAGDYMGDKLKVYMYPTHFLINRSGIIVKATNSIEEIIPFLNKELQQK